MPRTCTTADLSKMREELGRLLGAWALQLCGQKGQGTAGPERTSLAQVSRITVWIQKSSKRISGERPGISAMPPVLQVIHLPFALPENCFRGELPVGVGRSTDWFGESSKYSLDAIIRGFIFLS